MFTAALHYISVQVFDTLCKQLTSVCFSPVFVCVCVCVCVCSIDGSVVGEEGVPNTQNTLFPPHSPSILHKTYLPTHTCTYERLNEQCTKNETQCVDCSATQGHLLAQSTK